MDNPNYKITFMLDSAAMITVHTPKRGVVEVRHILVKKYIIVSDKSHLFRVIAYKLFIKSRLFQSNITLINRKITVNYVKLIDYKKKKIYLN